MAENAWIVQGPNLDGRALSANAVSVPIVRIADDPDKCSEAATRFRTLRPLAQIVSEQADITEHSMRKLRVQRTATERQYRATTFSPHPPLV